MKGDPHFFAGVGVAVSRHCCMGTGRGEERAPYYRERALEHRDKVAKIQILLTLP